jgi:hypothetical protein
MLKDSPVSYDRGVDVEYALLVEMVRKELKTSSILAVFDYLTTGKQEGVRNLSKVQKNNAVYFLRLKASVWRKKWDRVGTPGQGRRSDLEGKYDSPGWSAVVGDPKRFSK